MPRGMKRHWMLSGPFKEYNSTLGPGPMLLRQSAPPSGPGTGGAWFEWKECLLSVTESRELRTGIHNEAFFESRVQLITGRTHQIRAQFAAMGAPLLYDSLYEPLAGLTLDAFSGLDLPPDTCTTSGCRSALGTFERFCEDRRSQGFEVPLGPIGLQAARVRFPGRDVYCRPPWWRRLK